FMWPRSSTSRAQRLIVAVDGIADTADELAEILGFAEIAVDRSEAHIGDLVERGQRLHHQLADQIARNVRLAGAFELADDRVDDALDALGLDRALAQRDIDRARQLVALEGLALPVLLDDRQFAQLHALERGKARRAIGTEPAPPDRRAIIGRPRILDLCIFATAERTPHVLLPRDPPQGVNDCPAPRNRRGSARIARRLC